ncbi:MAG: alginate export family protein, partial [Pirellulaceae bacterium]
MKIVKTFRLSSAALLVGCAVSLITGTLLADPQALPDIPDLPAEETVWFEQETAPPADDLTVPEVPRFEEPHPRVAQPKYFTAPKVAPPKPKGSPYKGVYYDNDFSYLLDPAYDDWHLGENFKRLPAGNCGVLDFGGEYRMRQHHESGMRNGYTGLNDDFLLHRLRLYANYQVNDNLRFYGEMRHAVSEFERRTPRPVEEDYWDALNLFVDVRLAELASGELWGRYGRQELLYGSQRAVS